MRLFVHQLQSMLWIEETLAREVLPELFDAVGSPELRYDVEKHILETEGHVRNLHVVLTAIGERLDGLPTPVLPALRQEHASLLQTVPDDLHDLVHADAIARTEHLEIAAYTGMVHLAKALGVELPLVTRLRENLEQDAYALEQVEHAVAKLLAERVETRA